MVLPAFDPGLEHHFLAPLLAALTRLADGGQRPVLALNGPVGAGKSSLARSLQQRASRQGLALAVASIDDFYLPWEQRLQALAGNPFGVSRVPPGSHDVALALERLAAWQAGDALRLPRFDKTLRAGEGDRAGNVQQEAAVLLIEGWLLGCQPLEPVRLEQELRQSSLGLSPDEQAWLSHWNQALQSYQPLWQACSQLWLLRPQTWELPRRWRFQAEAQQRRRGAGWLSGKHLDGLVRASLHSLPPGLYQDPLLDQAVGVAVMDGRRRWIDGWVR